MGEADKTQLNLGQTAIDEQFDSVHVAAVFGSQKENRFGNLIRGTRAVHRYVGDGALYILVHLFVRHAKRGVVARCGNDTGANRIYRDFAISQISTSFARRSGPPLW